MPEKTMRDAINEALHQAMEQDESVFVIGEDVAGCNGSAGDVGAVGGVFGVTSGIYNRWPDRCVDTPISESAIVGCLLYTSPSPRDVEESRMPSSA